MQEENIESIFVTLDRSRLDKITVVNPEQPENIEPIFITFVVFRFDKSNEANFLQ